MSTTQCLIAAAAVAAALCAAPAAQADTRADMRLETRVSMRADIRLDPTARCAGLSRYCRAPHRYRGRVFDLNRLTDVVRIGAPQTERSRKSRAAARRRR